MAALPTFEAVRQAIFSQYQQAPTSNMDLSALGLGAYADMAMSTLVPAPSGISTATATASEWMEMVRFFDDSFYVTLQARTERDVFLRAFGISAVAMLQAKTEFNAILGDTIFPQLIRPETFYAGVVGGGGTPTRTWSNTVTAGWMAKFFQINNNQTSTTPILNTVNNVATLVFGLLDAGVSPKTLAVQWYDSAGAPQGVVPLPFVNLQQTTGYAILKKAFYIGKAKTMNVDAEFQSAGTAYLTPIGVQFVTSAYHTSE